VDAEVDSVHIKRIGIDDLVSYVYIVRVDLFTSTSSISFYLSLYSLKMS
jgi:hypothetical protein